MRRTCIAVMHSESRQLGLTLSCACPSLIPTNLRTAQSMWAHHERRWQQFTPAETIGMSAVWQPKLAVQVAELNCPTV